MKKILLFCSMMGAIGTTNVSAEISNNNNEFCTKIFMTSELIMKYRQMSVPITETFSDMEKLKFSTAEQELINLIVIDAYESPKFTIKEYQDNAVKEFANNQFIRCYKAMK